MTAGLKPACPLKVIMPRNLMARLTQNRKAAKAPTKNEFECVSKNFAGGGVRAAPFKELISHLGAKANAQRRL
jgi:hypothetical protein